MNTFSMLLIDGCGLLVGVVCVFSGNGTFRRREGMRNRKFIWSGLSMTTFLVCMGYYHLVG